MSEEQAMDLKAQIEALEEHIEKLKQELELMHEWYATGWLGG